MKFLMIALLSIISSNCCFSQKITSIDDIQLIVRKINGLKLKTAYEFQTSTLDSAGNRQEALVTYQFMDDSLQDKLLKVVVTDAAHKQYKNYYFNDDQLVYIRDSFGLTFFRDSDFVVGHTWKDENDINLVKREREIANAYKMLTMYKKVKAQQ